MSSRSLHVDRPLSSSLSLSSLSSRSRSRSLFPRSATDDAGRAARLVRFFSVLLSSLLLIFFVHLSFLKASIVRSFTLIHTFVIAHRRWHVRDSNDNPPTSHSVYTRREDLIVKFQNDIPSFTPDEVVREVDKFLLDGEMLDLMIKYSQRKREDPSWEPAYAEEDNSPFTAVVNFASQYAIWIVGGIVLKDIVVGFMNKNNIGG